MDPNVVQLLKLLKDLLPPHVYQNIIVRIVEMMESTDPAMHRAWAALLMEWVRAHYPRYAELMRLIIQRIAPAALGEGAAAGGAAAAGEGAAAGAGGAAVALTAAQIAAILAAIVAIVFAGWAIYSESQTGLYVPPGAGQPCNVLSPGAQQMSRMTRVISVWGWGSRSTLNKAIRLAEADCQADAAKCGTGGCGGGKSCLPSLAIQKVSSFNGVLATRVVLEYTCPCVCQ